MRRRFVWAVSYEFPKWVALGRFGERWQVSGALTLMGGHPFDLNYNGIDDYSGAFSRKNGLTGGMQASNKRKQSRI